MYIFLFDMFYSKSLNGGVHYQFHFIEARRVMETAYPSYNELLNGVSISRFDSRRGVSLNRLRPFCLLQK